MKISIKYLVLSIIGFAVWSLLAASPAYAGELSNQFTAELWVKPTNVVSRALMVKNNEIRLVTDASGKPLCQIYSSGAWQTAATSSVALTTNTWQHVACTYDRATLRVYVNGTQTGSQALTVALTDSATNFRIGSDEGGTYSDFSGVVDEHKVYNYPRTPAQILQDMQGTANAGVSGGSVLPDPIAHYSFDEQQGQSAHNKSIGGSSLDGTLGANSSASTDDPTWKTKADCKVNGCLGFDGGDYISAGDLSNFDFSNSDSKFSISAWVKPTTADTQQIVLSKHNPTNNQRGWAVGIETDNKMTIWLSEDGTYSDSTTVRYQTADTVPTSEFHHWTFTVDVSTDTFEIYKDGVLQSGAHANSKTTITDIYQNTSFVGIGILGNLISNFNGYIDEVKIYNTALTEDQVRQDMNSGSALAFGGVNGASEADELADGAGNPPIAEWKFDEKTGGTAYDTSGNGNDGAITGAAWKSGCQQGACLEFDGNGDRVYLGSSQIVGGTNLAEDFTIEASIKAGSDSNGRVVFSQNNSSQGNTLFELITNNTQLAFNARNDAGTLYQVTASTRPLDNQWHHVSVTRNGTSLLFYLDGQQLTSSTSFSPSGTFTFNEVYIGTRSGNDLVFTGLIDHVKIYNYARTPAQIAYDYNRGAPVAHWKFNECQGATIHDSAGSNNGTLTVTTTGGNTNGVGTCNTSSSAWGTGANGKFGSSLNFDGDGDYVNLPVSSTFIPSENSSITVSAWLKASTIGASNYANRAVTISRSSNTSSLILGFDNTNKAFYYDGGTRREFVGTISTDEWVYLAVTYNGTEAQLYKNGVANGSPITHTLYAGDENTDARIASAPGTLGSFFNGQIDEVQIFNYALSANQVRKLYNGGAAVKFGE